MRLLRGHGLRGIARGVAPVQGPTITTPGPQSVFVFTAGVAITSYDFKPFFIDRVGAGLIYDIVPSLPAGLTFVNGVLAGTATSAVPERDYIVRATDINFADVGALISVQVDPIVANNNPTLASAGMNIALNRVGSAPARVSTIPTDNATDIALDVDIVLEFDKDVIPGTGVFSIKKTSDNTTIRTHDVTNLAQVTINGPDVTLVSTGDLPYGEFYVTYPAGIVTNKGGISCAAEASTTAISATTIVAPPGGSITFKGFTPVTKKSGSGTENLSLTSLGLLQNDIVFAVQVVAAASSINCGVSDVAYTEIIGLNSPDTIDINLSVSWKLMGSVPDTSVVFNSSGSSGRANLMFAFAMSGADTVDPISVDPSNTAPISTNLPDPNAIVSAVLNELGIVIVAGSMLTGETVGYSMTGMDQTLADFLAGTTNSGGFIIGIKALGAAGSTFNPPTPTGPTADATVAAISSVFSVKPA